MFNRPSSHSSKGQSQPGPKTKSAKAAKEKPKGGKANKVPVDHAATQNLPSRLVVALGMTSTASSQNYAASKNMKSTNKAPPSDHQRSPTTQTIVAKEQRV